MDLARGVCVCFFYGSRGENCDVTGESEIFLREKV